MNYFYYEPAILTVDVTSSLPAELSLPYINQTLFDICGESTRIHTHFAKWTAGLKLKCVIDCQAVTLHTPWDTLPNI